MYFRKNGIKITGRTYVDDQGVKYPHPRWMEGATDAQLAALGATKHLDPVKPHFNETYQTTTLDASGEYVVTDLPLEEVKAKKVAEINAKRDEVATGGFIYNGNTFDSDEVSIGRINSVFTFATHDPEHTQNFITADNQTVTLTNADCLALGYAAGVHIQTQVFTARALKDAVAAATTSQEVVAITWPE